MGRPRFLTFSLVFLLAWVLVLGMNRSARGEQESEKAASKPLVIKSKTLEIDDIQKIVTFVDQVNAKKEEFTIDCQKLLVFYRDSSPSKDNTEEQLKIDKIVATGDVRIDRTEGGLATAEKAVYYQQEEKMVLTGNPVVKQGSDFVEGDRILIFLKENRSIVESSKDKRVKAVIFPRRENQ
ncbi:MAG: lipopolysaccharide transport periplasmic protein LptA [Desulfatiglans sp.]|jgi:lipopolysaccharide export system protein LptA|nr:lipopolysaccharide transport periplasmic protein LptA [Thermodesulfobacteriota bacterium]MEE4353766.1 lipopolysaccharide transport periplasmic protein LptA [Desulfatiglans sp.]